MTTCSRSGCTKKLRIDNSKGCCSSGCLSADAPPAGRAKGVVAIAAKPKVKPDEVTAAQGAAVKFRAVHDAMGMDPEKTLEEFYSSWLEGIRQALDAG